MRIIAIAKRILNQIRHDKRTVALLILAPIIILSLVHFVFVEEDKKYNIGIVNVDDNFVSKLDNIEGFDLSFFDYNTSDGIFAIKDGLIIALLDETEDEIKIYLDSSNTADGKQISTIIKNTSAMLAKEELISKLSDLTMNPKMEKLADNFDFDSLKFKEKEINTEYIYGSSNASFFDNFGAPLVGIIVFFLVFLIAGINFLSERTTGTLEKLLTTPVKRYEIILGYILGFSILAVIQAVLTTLFVIYVLKMTMLGNIFYAMLITLLTAICALSLGILLSTLAESEFQMIQFIPIVIIPQVFLSGIFPLPESLNAMSKFIPLYYTSHALNEIMLKGTGFSSIIFDALILFAFTLVFIILNVLFLKKQRKV